MSVIALLVSLAVLVDVGVARRAESVIQDRVGQALGAPVEASIGGFGSGFAVLGGHISTLDIHADRLTLTDVSVPGDAVEIQDLNVHVTDLELDGNRPVAGDATFSAVLSQDQVLQLIPQDLADRVTLGTDRLMVDLGITTVALDVVVTGDTLSLQLPGGLPVVDQLLSQATEVPLQVPDGVTVRDAMINDGALVLTGTLDPVAVTTGN